MFFGVLEDVDGNKIFFCRSLLMDRVPRERRALRYYARLKIDEEKMKGKE